MRKQQGKSTKNDVAHFSEGIEDVQCNSIFGRYSETEMLAQLQALAMDPCRPQFAQDNIQPLWNQIIILRKVMLLKDSEIPWRKRKLKQLVKNKLIAPADLELPNQQNKPKLSRKQFYHASSVSNTLSSPHSGRSLVSFDDSLPAKKLATTCSFIDDVADLNCALNVISRTVDSYEPVYGSNHLTSENSRISAGPHNRHVETPRRSPRLLNFIGDHLQRKVIPVGPRFQAVIPKWDDQEDRSTLFVVYKSNSDNLKWLGSCVWPLENGRTRAYGRNIGEGRHSCSCCVSLGSSDCTEKHILEERVVLLCDLGPAFLKWKFEQMGEQVSQSWTLEEQRTFESLMKKKPSPNEKSFWKRALKSFSNKSKTDIANYYFNVYIPRRMSLHRKSLSIKQIDTDNEDEAEDTGLQQEPKGKKHIIAKNTKAKYLRTS